MNEFAEILNLFIANVIAYTFFVAVYSFIMNLSSSGHSMQLLNASVFLVS